MTIKLEVGKKYRNRKGEVITIKRFDCDGVRFVYQGDDFFFYDQEGICAFSALPRLIEEVIEEPLKKPHKHAEALTAIAEGKTAQYESYVNDEKAWIDGDNDINPINYPGFSWRIKPEPKPDVVTYTKAKENFIYSPANNRLQDSNLKLTFDGTTGALKSAEVLK